MTARLGPDAVVVPAEGVHVTVVEDEKVLYLPHDASLRHLDRAAALVWDCLAPPAPVSDIVADLAAVFEADQDVVAADVDALLGGLVDGGALVVAVGEITPDA